MRKNRQALKYIVSDYLAATIAWFLFNLLRFNEVAIYGGFRSLKDYLLHYPVWEGQLLVPFCWLFLYYLSGYYNKPLGKSRLGELFSTLVTVVIGVVLVFFIFVLNDLPRSFHIYYELFFSLLGLQFVLTYIPRLCITRDGLHKIKSRKWALNVLIIGTSKQAVCMFDDLYRLGYNPVGLVSEEVNSPIAASPHRVLGHRGELTAILTQHQVDELVVVPDSPDSRKLVSILYNLYHYKLPIKVLADQSNLLSKVKIRTIHGAPLVDVTDNNFSEMERNLKLCTDKLFSLLALLLLSPLFLYIARRVKRDSSGSIFYKQERVGYMGKPFMMYKFRTMYTNSEQGGPLLSAEDDTRITPFGRIMRKYRLDELPQFWNVLKGDMSLVGPRPERKYYIDLIVQRAPVYYLLHNVRPGITSWGMVKYGYAGSVDEMIKRLEYDILYYENMSLALDITILAYTIKTVITGKGI